jgi:hypothetical protein
MERIGRQRKSIRWCILGLCLLGNTFAYSSGNLSTDSLRSNIIRIADSQIGVKEATGNNDGLQVEAYLKSCGLKKGNPWCVSYIFWCFQQAGILLKIVNPAFSPNWFQANVVYRKDWRKTDFKCKPAQVAGFFIASKGRIGHGELIKYEDRNNYYTDGGNTNGAGSDEGDGVYPKIRQKQTIYIISDPVLSVTK